MSGQSRLWALDFDQDGLPDVAHLITGREQGPWGTVHVTACGERLDAANHPRGWWRTEGLPLQERWVHCGAAGKDGKE